MGASTQPQELLQQIHSGKTVINLGNLYTGIFTCALSDGFLIPVEANAYPRKQWWAEYEAPPEPVEGGDSGSRAAAADGGGWTSTEANSVGAKIVCLTDGVDLASDPRRSRSLLGRDIEQRRGHV